MSHPSTSRIEYLDTTKGLLTLGMVLAHVIQFFAIPTYWLDVLSLQGNLVSFSGFLFCFGYVTYGAYLHKDPIPRMRMAHNGIKVLLAFYLSAMVYTTVVLRETDISSLASIVFLMKIPGYSEFLPAFAIILLFAGVAAPFINRLTASKQNLLITTGLCLACCFLPYSLISFPPLGLLIGTEDFAAFPVVQYFPLFLIGCFFARQQVGISKRYALLSLVLILSFAIANYLNGHFPTRFPPSLIWVASSFGMVYVYFALAIVLEQSLPGITRWLHAIGRNVLFWLVASNLALYLLVPVLGLKTLNIPETLGAYAAIIVIILYMHTLIRPIYKTE